MNFSNIKPKYLETEKIQSSQTDDEYQKITYKDKPFDFIMKDVKIFVSLVKHEKSTQIKYKIKLESDEIFEKMNTIMKKLNIDEDKYIVYKSDKNDKKYLTFSEFFNGYILTDFYDENKKILDFETPEEIKRYFKRAICNILVRFSIIKANGYMKVEIKQARVTSKIDQECIV